MSTKYSGTPEGEMIRLLEGIERTLKSTAITKKEIKPEKGSAAETRALKAEIKNVLKPLTASVEKASSAIKDLRGNASKLNRQLETSRTRFSGLNLELGKFLKNLTNNKLSPEDFDRSIFSAANDVGSSLVDIKRGVINLNRHLGVTNDKFAALNIGISRLLGELNSNGISNRNQVPVENFNTDDIVHAVVDTKHVIQQFIKAYTDHSSSQSKSIIDAINNLALTEAKFQQRPITNDNPVIQQSNEIRQESASTQPVATAQNTTTQAAQAAADAARSLADSQNAAANATNQNLASTNQSGQTTKQNTSAKANNTKAMISNNRLISDYLLTRAREMRSITGLTGAFDHFKTAIEQATKQFFFLAEMGMGSVGNMLDLNVAAIKSGMTTQEYTEMFVKNMEFAARAKSVDNFDGITSANNQRLAELGIFGASAKKMQVEMAQFATEMGVSQDKIPETSAKLVEVFGKLNKTVSMTSQEFMETIQAIRESNVFADEAAGLNQQERQARLIQLTESYNFGRTLGLSAKEADKLGKAMLEQRKFTVKERFKETGKLLQLASMTGNAQMIPELQRLSMKGRARTAEDEARFTELLGRMNVDAQRMVEDSAQSNQLGIESNVTGLLNDLSGETQERMRGKAKADTADQSGKLGQDAFGKEVGFFGRFVGQFGSVVQGMMRNEILGPILSGLFIGLGFIFSKTIAGALVETAKFFHKKDIRGRKTATPSNTPPTGKMSFMEKLSSAFNKGKDLVSKGFSSLGSSIKSSSSSLGNLMSGAADFIKSAASKGGGLISGAANSFTNIMKSMPSSLSNLLNSAGNLLSKSGSFLGNSLKAAGSILKGIPIIGSLITIGIELFTGNLRNAFSPNGGFFNAIGSAILSIPYGIADLVVSGLEFILGDSLLKPVRTVLDSLGAGIMAGLNTLMAGIAKSISWFTDFLPDDSKLKQMVKNWSDNASRVAEDSQKTLSRTMNGETLANISKENKKIAERQSEKDKSLKVDTKSEPTKKLSDPSTTKSENNVGDKNNSDADPTLQILNSILLVLTEIRDTNKLSQIDPELNPVKFSSALETPFGNLSGAQQRILRQS